MTSLFYEIQDCNIFRPLLLCNFYENFEQPILTEIVPIKEPLGWGWFPAINHLKNA